MSGRVARMPRQGSKGEREQRLARGALLMVRYSIEISRLLDDLLGPELSANHEVLVLTHLYSTGSCGPAELRRVTGQSRAGLARLLERLERAGFIERRQGDRDRRTVVASLTAPGRRRLGSIDQALERHFVATAPLVRELCAALDREPPAPSGDAPSLRAIEIMGRMGAAGAPFADELVRETGVGGLRSRLALTALVAEGEMRPGRLAEILGLSSGGLTYLVDQLEASDLVERRYGAVPDDRRAVILALTERGRAVGRAALSVFERHSDAMCSAVALSLRSTQ